MASSIDYMLSDQAHLWVHYDTVTLDGMSDHCLQFTHLPTFAHTPLLQSHPASSEPKILHKWVEGRSVQDYAISG